MDVGESYATVLVHGVTTRIKPKPMRKLTDFRLKTTLSKTGITSPWNGIPIKKVKGIEFNHEAIN